MLDSSPRLEKLLDGPPDRGTFGLSGGARFEFPSEFCPPVSPHIESSLDLFGGHGVEAAAPGLSTADAGRGFRVTILLFQKVNDKAKQKVEARERRSQRKFPRPAGERQPSR